PRRPPQSPPLPSSQKLWSYKTLQTAGFATQSAPLVKGQINNDQTCSRQVFLQLLSCFDIARCHKHQSQLVQAGVMGDNKKTLHFGRRLLDKGKNGGGRWVLQLLRSPPTDEHAELPSAEFPGFLRANGRRYQRKLRNKALGCQISADRRGVLPSTVDQSTQTVFAAAAPGLHGFRMSE